LPQARDHVVRAGVLLHVFQGFLENPVEDQLGFGRQPRGRAGADERDGDAGAFRESGGRGAQGGDQAQDFEDAGTQVPRNALHDVGGAAHQIADREDLTAQRPGARGKVLRQHAEADEERAETLGGAIVQLEGETPAVGFLRLEQAVGQSAQRSLAPPRLGHVGHHQAEGRAAGAARGQPVHGDLRRHPRIVRGVQVDLDGRNGPGDAFQDPRQRFLVGVRKEPVEGAAQHP